MLRREEKSLDEEGMGECHILSLLWDVGWGTAFAQRGEQMLKAETLGEQAHMYVL